jgi:hypothetical protein
VLLLLLMVRPDWDIIFSSPGGVTTVDGDPVWDGIHNSPHGAVAAIDGETLL